MTSSLELSNADTEKALRSINIPPRPQLLADLDQELRRNDPDPRRLAALIERDVSLSAAVLKTVNAPFFGLSRKVAAVGMAVQMLGLRNIRSLVGSLLLRQSVQGSGLSLERFWDSAEKIARLSAQIAGLLPRVPRDEAYTFGLFHDIGIPLMMQRFPDYRETLKRAAGVDDPLTVVEDAAHHANHAVIGYMVARTWGLPETLAEAIRAHHETDFLAEERGLPAQSCTFVAINYLAEHLNDKVLRMRIDPQWEMVGDAVLDYLGLSRGELEELENDLAEI